MNIAIRVDASYQIGTGHVMRCLALAEELRKLGAEAVFVCREHPGHLCSLMESRGFEVRKLEQKNVEQARVTTSPEKPPHLPWLGTEQGRDAKQTIKTLQGAFSLDWIIVDHYALDQEWESALREVAARIMVIDDLADREHDCDLLLDQNYFREPGKRYHGLLPQNCRMLPGPRYSLLRPEFRRAREFCRMRGGGVGRVLVYFGGSDEKDLTGTVLDALDCPQLGHIPVDAVAGANNRRIEALKKKALKRAGIRLHVQPQGFVELMIRADLSICAGGVNTWERMCLGLPSLVVSVAANQEQCLADLDRDGYINWIGRKEEVSAENIRDAVQNFRLNDSAGPEHGLVDGYGAVRVASIIVDKAGLKEGKPGAPK